MGRINWLEVLGWTQDHLEDIRNAAYAYVRQGKYDIALPFFQALTVLDPMSAYDLQTLGSIYLQMNKVETAIEYFNKALAAGTDDDGPILLNLAKAHFFSGNVEEGIQVATTLKNHPNPQIASQATALVLAYS